MNNFLQYKLVFISLVLLVNFNFSHQRPNSIPDTVATISSNSISLDPTNGNGNGNGNGNLITTIESLPAVELLRELFIKQNEIADTVFPILVRAITNPVPGLAEAIQRSLSLFGVTSYLVGPTIARSARNLSPVVEPLVGSTDSIVKKIDQVSELEPLFGQLMIVFGLNNDQCKEAIACRAGQKVAADYPLLASYLSQASTTLKPEDDKFAKILGGVMSSPNPECSSSNCPNLSTIEKYWKESGEKDIKTVVKKAFADFVTV